MPFGRLNFGISSQSIPFIFTIIKEPAKTANKKPQPLKQKSPANSAVSAIIAGYGINKVKSVEQSETTGKDAFNRPCENPNHFSGKRTGLAGHIRQGTQFFLKTLTITLLWLTKRVLDFS